MIINIHFRNARNWFVGAQGSIRTTEINKHPTWISSSAPHFLLSDCSPQYPNQALQQQTTSVSSPQQDRHLTNMRFYSLNLCKNSQVHPVISGIGACMGQPKPSLILKVQQSSPLESHPQTSSADLDPTHTLQQQVYLLFT